MCKICLPECFRKWSHYCVTPHKTNLPVLKFSTLIFKVKTQNSSFIYTFGIQNNRSGYINLEEKFIKQCFTFNLVLKYVFVIPNGL